MGDGGGGDAWLWVWLTGWEVLQIGERRVGCTRLGYQHLYVNSGARNYILRISEVF